MAMWLASGIGVGGACGEFELTGLGMDAVMKFVPGLINASGSPSKIQLSCKS
jgi:hypothetical protein